MNELDNLQETEPTNSQTEENRLTFERIIKECPTAMLSSINADGNIVSRPMHTILDAEDKNIIWIFTKFENNICDQIQESKEVCLAYSDPARNSYMSVVGMGSLDNDKLIMEKYWSPIMKAWYPEGLGDPSMVLIRISAKSAEFWDGPSSKVVSLFGMAAAIIQGKEYHGEKDAVGKVMF